jgi:hypothetical protein
VDTVDIKAHWRQRPTVDTSSSVAPVSAYAPVIVAPELLQDEEAMRIDPQLGDTAPANKDLAKD